MTKKYTIEEKAKSLETTEDQTLVSAVVCAYYCDSKEIFKISTNELVRRSTF